MALPRLTSLFFLGLSLQRRYGCDMFLLLVLGALISALLISGLSLCAVAKMSWRITISFCLFLERLLSGNHTHVETSRGTIASLLLIWS